ncbi:MAG: malectin domain-containing carbohydrate-binding protein, partial [Capsulimonadaceae bacterium]
SSGGGGGGGGGTSGPVDINCGGAATGSWIADTDFSGGTAVTTTNTVSTTAVTNPAPEAVYQSNRYNAPAYTIGGLTSGSTYTVRLHFAETYWTASGKREFNVTINGTQVLTDFDIFKTAGGENIANIQQFTTTANSSGQIVITSANVIDNAQFNGIEIDAGSGSGGSGGISGTQTLTPECATGSRLDDSGAGTANGNKIDIWAANGTGAQSWTFSSTGVSPAGDYNLAVLGPYCLQASGTTSGSATELWACDGASSQSWTIVADESPSGYYQLKPATNGALCLDVEGAGTANGTVVDTYTCNSTNAQQWLIP